ncbi:hypothetical protein RRG08_034280 [Elysia crispata]|uniref:Nose resistant-to-fluoxetine protein N-terminal domain-containing protein n=1 Tax=Elysia crispata TaxID=231223 RepID=A0AAE1A2C5_9GAST|nr:hypothetical protein RRG08_034280 [Elysia crispata]
MVGVISLQVECRESCWDNISVFEVELVKTIFRYKATKKRQSTGDIRNHVCRNSQTILRKGGHYDNIGHQNRHSNPTVSAAYGRIGFVPLSLYQKDAAEAKTKSETKNMEYQENDRDSEQSNKEWSENEKGEELGGQEEKVSREETEEKKEGGNEMTTHKWTAFFLVCAAIRLQFAAADTKNSTRSAAEVLNTSLINDGSSANTSSIPNNTSDWSTSANIVKPAMTFPSRKVVASRDNANRTTTTTTAPATEENKALADFTRMLGLLRRAGGLLRDSLMRGQPLTQTQTQQLMEFARQFGNTLSSLPDSLQSVNSTRDVIKLLRDSGVLQNLTNIGSPFGGSASQGSKAAVNPQPHTVHWLKCQADLLTMVAALGTQQMWALKMLDSWGKPESSILRGKHNVPGQQRGVYQRPPHRHSNFRRCPGQNVSHEHLPGVIETFGDEIIPITLDTCLPHSCESVDLNSALRENGYPFIIMTCTADLDIGDDPWAIVAIIILSIFLALMVAGTLAEFCVESKSNRKSDYINAFINNSSGADFVNGGVNGMTSNGSTGNPYGLINEGFEMRDVGYITAGSDAKIPSSNGYMSGTKKDVEPGQHETKLREDDEKKNF